MHLRKPIFALAILASTALAGGAAAQDDDYAMLMAQSDSGLRGELQQRYDAGLALSQDQASVAADDPRYLWALETKVQCGIAIGFMKTATRDETSIRKCAEAYMMMQRVPAPPVRAAPPPPPPRRPDSCNDDVVGLVFFDFDQANITGDGAQTISNVVDNIRDCGWRSLTVVGHTDQAGSDQYNIGLSQARADAVESALRSRGTTIAISTRAEGESNPRVPLPDGTRNPQNRRVEISAD